MRGASQTGFFFVFFFPFNLNNKTTEGPLAINAILSLSIQISLPLSEARSRRRRRRRRKKRRKLSQLHELSPAPLGPSASTSAASDCRRRDMNRARRRRPRRPRRSSRGQHPRPRPLARLRRRHGRGRGQGRRPRSSSCRKALLRLAFAPEPLQQRGGLALPAFFQRLQPRQGRLAFLGREGPVHARESREGGRADAREKFGQIRFHYFFVFMFFSLFISSATTNLRVSTPKKK